MVVVVVVVVVVLLLLLLLLLLPARCSTETLRSPLPVATGLTTLEEEGASTPHRRTWSR